MAACPLRFFLLQTGRVGKHDTQERSGRRRAVDRSSKSLAHESRQVTGVIDVRVTQHDRVEGPGIRDTLGPVSESELLESLEESAVEEDSPLPGANQVHGTRDGSGGSEELERGGSARRLTHVPMPLSLLVLSQASRATEDQGIDRFVKEP